MIFQVLPVSFTRVLILLKMVRLLRATWFYVESLCDGRTFILDYAYPGNRQNQRTDCGHGTEW